MSLEDFSSKEAMLKNGEEPPTTRSRVASWLRGFVFFVLVLAVAGLLAWFLLITPLQNQVADLTVELQGATEQVATLQAARPLQEVYSLLADANTARFELMRNRSASASAALLSSEQTLASLEQLVGERFADTLGDIRERLELVKADITADDTLAALSDLDVLVNILTQLQRTISE